MALGLKMACRISIRMSREAGAVCHLSVGGQVNRLAILEPAIHPLTIWSPCCLFFHSTRMFAVLLRLAVVSEAQAIFLPQPNMYLALQGAPHPHPPSLVRLLILYLVVL